MPTKKKTSMLSSSQLDRDIDQALAAPRASVTPKRRPGPRDVEPDPDGYYSPDLPEHYYVFYYPLGPKQHLGNWAGPYDTLAEARAEMRAWIRNVNPDPRSYKIRRVTPARFEKIWGRLPPR